MFAVEMWKVVFVLGLVAGIIEVTCGNGMDQQTECSLNPFNDISNYNLYSLSSIYGIDSDVEGRVAANGPIFYENYSVGLKNQVNAGYSLVSSSSIEFTSGSVWHGSVIGTDVGDLINVSIMIDGTVQTSNECCPDTSCNYCVSTNEAALPFDFDVVDSYLLETSLFWSSLPATEGTVVDYSYQALTLTCGNDNFNHFTDIHLDGITSIEIICAESASVVIDYTIDTLAMQNLGISLTGGIKSSHIIHHFCGPTLQISGIDVLGVVYAPWSDVQFPFGVINGQVFAGAVVGLEQVSTVSAAFNDECGKYGSGHAIVTDATGSMVFEADSQAMFVQTDGSATITGRAHTEVGDVVFDVNILLSGYTKNPPSGSPKKELKSSCYSQNGGSVDPTTWVYFQEISGTMTGVVGSVYEGVVLSITRMGPAAQVGLGANGKNIDNGLSFWFTFELVQQSPINPFPVSGYGDFNLNNQVLSSLYSRGQINHNPFDGCVPTPSNQQFVCCAFENSGIINHFCSENECVMIEGWTLLTHRNVNSCSDCTCPE